MLLEEVFGIDLQLMIKINDKVVVFIIGKERLEDGEPYGIFSNLIISYQNEIPLTINYDFDLIIKVRRIGDNVEEQNCNVDHLTTIKGLFSFEVLQKIKKVKVNLVLRVVFLEIV